MSIIGLLNQSISVYNKASLGADGRPVYSTATSIKGRIEIVTKRSLMPDGTILIVDALLMVASTVTLNTDDKIAYNDINYKIIDVFEVPGGSGQISHKEARLQKWPS